MFLTFVINQLYYNLVLKLKEKIIISHSFCTICIEHVKSGLEGAESKLFEN